MKMGRDMKLKEEIHAAVEEMEARELTKISDYIKIIKRMRAIAPGKKAPPIERIHEMTRQSKSRWGDAVMEDREERF